LALEVLQEIPEALVPLDFVRLILQENDAMLHDGTWVLHLRIQG